MKKKKIVRRLNELRDKHLHRLAPHEHHKELYEVKFPVENHLYLMFLIGDLIKVCIRALEDGEYIKDRHIPQPEYNVREVLRHVLDLIPYQEQEFIDKTKAVIDHLNKKDEG